MPTATDTARQRGRRGFAALEQERQRAIASKGGKAAHALGKAHEFTAEQARAAGRKGGEAVSKDRGHMAEIGRLGGLSRARKQEEALAKAGAVDAAAPGSASRTAAE